MHILGSSVPFTCCEGKVCRRPARCVRVQREQRRAAFPRELQGAREITLTNDAGSPRFEDLTAESTRRRGEGEERKNQEVLRFRRRYLRRARLSTLCNGSSGFEKRHSEREGEGKEGAHVDRLSWVHCCPFCVVVYRVYLRLQIRGL